MRFCTGFLSMEGKMSNTLIMNLPIDCEEKLLLSDIPFIHLQWFAPEDEGQTEEPTEHKLRKSREDGKVAKTSELAPALIMIFTSITIVFLAGYMFNILFDTMIYFFTITGQTDITLDNRIGTVLFKNFFKLFIPVAVIAFFAALAGNLLQVGFLFSVKPITPDFNRISPNFIKYFKRSVFSLEAVFNLGKTLLKVAIIGAIVYLNLKYELDKLVLLSNQTIQYSMHYISLIAFKLIVEAGAAFLFLSLPDYMFQRKQHRDSLKMSKQEIKEESKQMEGDPKIKNMLMERMRALMEQNIGKTVPQSDVIVTNPTHYSIAITYNNQLMEGPFVSAKGEDQLAFRIREIATENNIPIMENKPLARALYAEVKVGEEIPIRYWETVSIILSEVYKLTGKMAV